MLAFMSIYALQLIVFLPKCTLRVNDGVLMNYAYFKRFLFGKIYRQFIYFIQMNLIRNEMVSNALKNPLQKNSIFARNLKYYKSHRRLTYR